MKQIVEVERSVPQKVEVIVHVTLPQIQKIVEFVNPEERSLSGLWSRSVIFSFLGQWRRLWR